KEGKKSGIPFYDYILAGLATGLGLYMLSAANRIIESGGQINQVDMYIGIIVLVLLLEITRRLTGWGLTLLALGFLIYGFYVKLSIYPELTSPIVQAYQKTSFPIWFISRKVFWGLQLAYRPVILFYLF